HSPSRAASERQSTATLSPKRLVTPSIVNSNSSGAVSAAEGLGLALLHLFRRQIFLVSRDGPGEAEGVLHMAIAIPPELIGQRHGDGAAGRNRRLECGVAVGD